MGGALSDGDRRPVLLVEDESVVRSAIAEFLKRRGYEVAEAPDGRTARSILERVPLEAVLLDYSLPDTDGLEILSFARQVDLTLPVVILTAHGSIDLAVRAIKEGADQFLTKPAELKTLLVLIERLIENRRQRHVNLAGRTRENRDEVDPFLGSSPAIRRLAERAAKLVAASSPVLIQGETGTGKGVLARWLHRNGSRAEEAFVDLNCAGLSTEFLDTELFGHEKGAFTGASDAKPGLFEVAHRGTLFLDEIGDVASEIQPKLLKVLEEQRFRRLGSVRDRQVDVRLIAASHHDLAALMKQGGFRSDLYFRISTVPLVVPPLRERGDDVLVLARFLLGRIAMELGRPLLALADSAEGVLRSHDWPGNVRELRNVLERVALLSERESLTDADLRDSGGFGPPTRTPAEVSSLEDVERDHIERVLVRSEGDVPAAARILGLSRSGLYKKIKRLGVRLPDQ